MNKSLAAALKNLTEFEAESVWMALADYVANQEEHVALDEGVTDRDRARLVNAREVLERMNAAMARRTDSDE